MHKIFQNNWIKGLIILNLFIGSIYVVYAVKSRINVERQKNKLLESTGGGLEADGQISKADFVKLIKMSERGQKNGLSDDDYEWIVERLKEAFGQKHPWACMNRSDYADVLVLKKNLTESQKEECYQLAVTLLNLKKSQNEAEGCKDLDKTTGMKIIAFLKDKRGVTYLLPLLDSPDKHTQETALKVLKLIGYTNEGRISK